MKIDVAEIEERIAKCQKILEADPNSQIFAALADALRKKGNAPKALEICIRGIDKHPDYGSAYIVLAKIYLDQGNYADANRQLQKAITVGGRTRSVDVLEAEILIKLGQVNKARSILEKIYSSDPRNESVRNLLVSLDETPAKEHSDVPDLLEIVRRPEPASQREIAHSEFKRNHTLSHALSIIKILPRVLGVVAVTKDGMVVEGHFDGMLSRDELGALASAAFDNIIQAISRVDFGMPNEILVEAEQSKLWIFNKQKFLIVISTRDDVNLGSLKLKINEIFKQTEF
jgi:predicted regulator of Ras-like GTPase activity (Roadblock/LC7/MglB family)